ncbi:MAG: DUF2791 family P-loop domain-containing protein [Candidatus Jordarchaeaceae archaeon]
MSYSIGVPQKARIIWADMKETKTELDRFVNAKFADNVSVLVILGDYGTGKSHSLNYITYLSQNLKDIRLQIITFEHPCRNFVEFLEKVESHLSFEEICAIIKRSIAKRKSQLATLLKKGYDEDVLDSVMVFEKAHDLVLKSLYPQMHSDLRTILAKLLATDSKETFDLAKKWLRGVPLTATQLRNLGVTGKISVGNAPDISADYLRIYLSDGGCLLILIDEFEDLGVIGDQESLVSFRHFLDENLPRTKIVVTMTDEAFEGLRTGKKVFLRKSYVPLWSRFNTCRKLRLSNLNKENTKLFLIEYIESVNKSLEGKVSIEDNALQTIYQFSNGSPRLLSTIAEYFCLMDKFDGKIDGHTISTAIEDIKLKLEAQKTSDIEKVAKI